MRLLNSTSTKHNNFDVAENGKLFFVGIDEWSNACIAHKTSVSAHDIETPVMGDGKPLMNASFWKRDGKQI